MAKYIIELEVDTSEKITLGMICRGLEYNENTIRNEIFSECPNIVGDMEMSYKIVSAQEIAE